MDKNNAIYGRLKDETDKAYNAFNIFLELGSNRCLIDVSRRLSVSKANVARWSKKHRWFERAAAYDKYIQESVIVAVIEQEIDVRTQMMKNIQLLLKAQEKEIIIRLSEQDRKIANPDYDYRPSSIRTISETGKLAMEHLTLLEPQEQVKDDDTGDLFKLVKDCKELANAPDR